MPDRRRLPLASLRLRGAARPGAAPDRPRGPRRAPLHGSGGPRDRPPEQAARLRAAGVRARHRRGEPRARLPGGRAGLGDREPDPRRPRSLDDSDPDEQPEEAERPRGVRPDRGRAGADRDGAERREPALPCGQAREARPPAPPPGPALRLGAEGVSDGLDQPRLRLGPDPDEERREDVSELADEPEAPPEPEPAAEAEPAVEEPEVESVPEPSWEPEPKED